MCIPPTPGALVKLLMPPRPSPGRPRPTCKVSALYLENCANALRQKDRQTETDRDRQTILFIDIDISHNVINLTHDLYAVDVFLSNSCPAYVYCETIIAMIYCYY